MHWMSINVLEIYAQDPFKQNDRSAIRVVNFCFYKGWKVVNKLEWGKRFMSLGMEGLFTSIESFPHQRLWAVYTCTYSIVTNWTIDRGQVGGSMDEGGIQQTQNPEEICLIQPSLPMNWTMNPLEKTAMGSHAFSHRCQRGMQHCNTKWQGTLCASYSMQTF